MTMQSTSADRKSRKANNPSAPQNGADDFKRIDSAVRDMSKVEAEQRFSSASQVELLTWYERGSILNHARTVWFDKEDPAGYQSWVLGSLRIDLALSNRLVRVHSAILHSGLASDDFKGIPLSSVLFMLPILRHVNTEVGATPDQTEKYRAYRDALPELLKLARTGTVLEVKAECYRLRGMKLGLGKAHAREIMRLGDYRRREVFFRHVANECAAAETPFAFFTVDPETGMYAAGNSRFPKDAEFRKVWKECVARLGEATAYMRKPKLAANQEKLEQQASALSQRIEQVSEEVAEELDDRNAEDDDSTGASA